MARILIVEDEAIIALMLKKYLISLSHEIVAVVKTGIDAIEKTKALDPEIILMDIKILGKMSGIEAVIEIRKFSSLPVIFTSGNLDKELIKELTSLGSVQAISKPILFEQLDNALLKSLSSRN